MPVSLLRIFAHSDGVESDASLMERYTLGGDQAALAELVRRHGPLVYRVCRRLAPSVADDAFQAVFLSLAQSAGSIRTPGAVAAWLVSVAGRTARRMRDEEQTRARRERAAGRREACEPPPDSADLAAALDDELSRLPDSLRGPVVLCLVRGLTHAQAAAELGGSVRTLRRRLDRARALLCERLERRGVAPAAAVTLLAGLAAPAVAVPPELVKSVAYALRNEGGELPAALAASAKGVRLMAKLKLLALAATAAGVLACLGAVRSGDESAQPPAPPAAPMRAKEQRPAEVAVPAPVREPEPAFRSKNFVVYAPTETMARVIASEAEHHRRALAEKWVGRELPAWAKPCTIRYSTAPKAANGTSTFVFGHNDAGERELGSAKTDLEGEFLPVLMNTLPHEMTHAVLATAFARPLPRWADEGVAQLSESAERQAAQDAKVREILAAGRGMQVKVLFRASEFPKDWAGLYAQGHSVARFLLTRAAPAEEDPHRLFVAFIKAGLVGNTVESWTKAADTVYGFASLDDLESAWLAWVKKRENAVPQKGMPPTEQPPEPSGASPPTNLPRDKPTR